MPGLLCVRDTDAQGTHKRLQDRTTLPIELDDITEILVELGYTDEVRFYPVKADPFRIRGAFYQYHYRPGVYADPVKVTLIPYNANDPLDLQRVVCCKELMHLFDTDLEKTDKQEEVPDFIEKVLGPLSTDDYGVADFMAAKDKIAIYQCLPLLLPYAALCQAREAVTSGQKTIEEVAAWAYIPKDLVSFMLDKEWDTLNGVLYR